VTKNHSVPKILVIDDDLDTLTLLRMALTRNGYNVSTASCWDEVADRLNILIQEDDGFDAILLDLMMPGRSGFDILTSMKVILKKVPPVIILSAKYSVEYMVKASDMGASKYLVKPIKQEKLMETLREVIQQTQRM